MSQTSKADLKSKIVKVWVSMLRCNCQDGNNIASIQNNLFHKLLQNQEKAASPDSVTTVLTTEVFVCYYRKDIL